ncbi:MAG: methylenetetrahydrofolate--tRNA-(uracil(54)-C(5))-methyltransferase (FADH(2)-oxidizing) TrmFO [Chloroflexota bacterium]
MTETVLTIIGGGLAGCEAAWQAAQRGVRVCLYEMRPAVATGAHAGADLAELVCSNSLGAMQADRASGVLKSEVERLGSLLLRVAVETAVPAGGALAVDREAFARKVTQAVEGHTNIQVIRAEAAEIPSTPAIVASGPLTSPALTRAILAFTGQEQLYFFDAIAPIVHIDSVDMTIAYRASRYGRHSAAKASLEAALVEPAGSGPVEVDAGEEGDYVNCPLTKDEYDTFIDALLSAERIALKDFELALEGGVRAGAGHFFEGCLPVEILARRGRDSLAFGPLRPVGLRDPRTGKRPYAVVQLRQDNLAGTLYNIVGFQTNLTFPEQRRVLRLIPGLQNAEFARYGQMHRNTFIFSPALLRPTLQTVARDDLFFAGQITGVEGYMGNVATGLLAGWNAARLLHGQAPVELPRSTMLGALCHYITHAAADDFQPMKANFGILPTLEETGDKPVRQKRQRYQAYAARSQRELEALLQGLA